MSKRIIFILLMSVFLWMGFICAISFMEAWLKFQAPGITVSLGLGIGKLVFAALNRMEWFFALIIFLSFIFSKQGASTAAKLYYGLVVSILILQAFWLLPVLDARADAYIRGENLSSSFVHLYFIAAEIIKLVFLFCLGVQIFRAFPASGSNQSTRVNNQNEVSS